MCYQLDNFQNPNEFFTQVEYLQNKLDIIVFPAYIIGSAAVKVLYAPGVLTLINNALTPITVWWLGLPIGVGILLIFGIARKEMTIFESEFGWKNATIMTVAEICTAITIGGIAFRLLSLFM